MVVLTMKLVCTESWAIDICFSEKGWPFAFLSVHRLQSEDGNGGGNDEATEAGGHVGGAASGGLDGGAVAASRGGDAGGHGASAGGVDGGGVVGDLVRSSGGDDRGDNDGRGGGGNLGHGRQDGGNGGDLRGGRAHGRGGVRGGSGGVGRGSSGVGRGSGSVGRRSSNLGGRRRGDNGAVVGDAELGGVLVLAGRVVDELDTVALGALGGDKAVLGLPGVAAAVGDHLGDGLDELEVLGRALEEDERDGALGGRVPRDGEGRANGHNGVEARLRDGVALGRITSGSGVGRDQRSEGGEAGGEETEHGGRHLEWVIEVGMEKV
jgi:hypothetical protein